MDENANAGNRMQQIISMVPKQLVGPVNRESFSRYLANIAQKAPKTYISYASAIEGCERYAQKRGFSSSALYTENIETALQTQKLLLADAEFMAMNKRGHNRYNAAMTQLLKFIGAGAPQIETVGSPEMLQTARVRQATVPVLPVSFDRSPYVTVLMQEPWLRDGIPCVNGSPSPRKLRQFKEQYLKQHGEYPDGSDEDVAWRIMQICVVIEQQSAFLPEALVGKELEKKLIEHIETSFANETPAIWYEALYRTFSQDFLYPSLVSSPDVLKEYLRKYLFDRMGAERFDKVPRDFFSLKAGGSKLAVHDPVEEIRTCLQEFARPVKYEEIYIALPHIPHSEVVRLLQKKEHSDFICNANGEYFHVSLLSLPDEDLEAIASIITRSIAHHRYIGKKELYDKIQTAYPDITEVCSLVSQQGFYNALKHKLEGRFDFRGNIISKQGQAISSSDVFSEISQYRERFTVDELQAIAAEFETSINFECVYANSMRINAGVFVSKDQARFDVDEIDNALERLHPGSYFSLGSFSNFTLLPAAGFPWNGFLLESYAAGFSKKYRLLNVRYNKTTCSGALVKRSCSIRSFDDLLIDVLANADVELEEPAALQYIREQGYLARRSYPEIKSVMLYARERRNRTAAY